MNGTFENMIKRYSEELLKMNREKALPDPSAEMSLSVFAQAEPEESEDKEETETDTEAEADEAAPEEKRQDISDIPGIESADFYQEDKDSFPPFTLDEPTDFAYFRARVFTGNNAYPIENARVLVIKDGKLFTFLSTDSDGITKKVKLPSYPEINSLEPESDEQYVQYTAEVYAKGFTPKKNLLVSAVGGSDVILDVQLTPLDERVK